MEANFTVGTWIDTRHERHAYLDNKSTTLDT